jgi:hypothetical protein
VPKAQTITVAFDIDEVIDSVQGEVLRKDIDEHGALHVLNGFGSATLRINGQPVMHLHIHEDAQGKVVVDAINRSATVIGRVYPEDDGVVPPRTVKPRTS